MQITTNLELSKKAFELGITKDFESVFWWRNDWANNPEKYQNKWYITYDYPNTGKHRAVKYGENYFLLPALTAEEWGSILSAGTIKISKCSIINTPVISGNYFWRVNYRKESYDNYEEADYLSDAMAKMAIYLKELLK